jgi:hypothetical protein
MSIKPQPEIEQLSIWTFLERLAVADGNRVSAEPLDANIIDLSNWIGSLDLESAGDALVTWGVSFRDRAIQLLDEWQLKSPLTPAELVEPFYDRSLFDDLVLGRMEWDLGELVERIEADYPTERQAAPGIAPVSKDAALELADLQTALDTAHDENVSEWGAAISIRLDQWEQPQQQSVPLLELQRAVELPLVQVWLALLLNGFEIEQRGEFYDTEQVWIVR